MRQKNKWQILILAGIILTLSYSLVSFSGANVDETLAAEAAKVWLPVAPLNTGRHSHTATKLPGGKILVAGGTQGDSNGVGLNSVEIYDPTSDVWTPAAPLNHARQSHTASLMPGGLVLITGGRNGASFLASMELYDPNTQAWTLTTPLNVPRYNHAATLLQDGNVMIIGGFNSSDGALTSVEVVNPAANTVTFTTPMNTPRNGHSAVALTDGRILVVGGYNQSQGWLATAELFDPSTTSWTTTNPIFCHGVFHSSTLLSDGRVLVTGGACGSGYPGITDKAEIFNPTTNMWQAVDPLPGRTHAHTATLLPDNQVLLAGGANGQTKLATAYLFNPASETWAAVDPLNIERRNFAAVLLDDGDVLSIGGWSNSSSQLDSVERYTIPNQPPNCSQVQPNPEKLWPPDHTFVSVDLLGVTDPDGDAVAVTFNSIFQDEPVDAPDSGNTSPDGQGMGTSTAQVRAERIGDGNGRVYHISFTADDGRGGTCAGEVLVGVPHDENSAPIDDGALYDSTVP